MSEKSLLARSLDAQFPSTAAQDLLSYTAGDWLPEKEQNALAVYAQAKVAAIREMIDSLGDPEDEAELYNTLAFFWVELKVEWNRYNQVMNYQLFRRGTADNSVMARGTLGSAVLARFETLLAPADLANLTEVAAQPLEIGSPDVTQLQKFLDRYERSTQVIHKAVALAGKAGAKTAELEAEAKEAMDLGIDVLWPAIRDQVTTEVKASHPFTLDSEWHYDATLSTTLVEPCAATIAAFIEKTLSGDAIKSPDERVAAGESAHLVFKVTFDTTESEPKIRVSFDGGSPSTLTFGEPVPA